jgi:nicotinamidase/pyrazinamidase
VQGTEGARFHVDLHLPPDVLLVDKGTDPQQENYSAFENSTLAVALRSRGVTRIWIGGLALDYCVCATALDALKAGFEVHVIVAATRAIDPRHGDRVLRELEAAGAKIEREDNHD